MDKARISAIWKELQEYGDETQLGFPLSTIKVGELAELISENEGYADTIERQAKDIAEFNTEANRLVAINRALINERDAALAEVARLKARAEKQADMIRTIDPLYR